ncbi:MAG TPA: hypothetical protein VGJ16_12175 [Pirellulales bacterium]|jgi:hypothetical protein
MDGKSAFASGWLVLILLSLALSSWANGEEPARGELRVARLVRDLGSASFVERQSAEDQLLRLGNQTRAELQQALESSDVEVRLRAARLLERIELEEIWSPGRVDLVSRGEPASKILLALANQTGNHVHVGDPYGNFSDRPLDVEYRGCTYWEAIDDVCSRSVNRVRPHYDMHTPGVVASAGEPGEFPRAYGGPLRAQITAARRLFVEDLSYEDGKAELAHSFQFGLQLTWEDRFRLVGYCVQPELVEAVTNNGLRVSSAQSGGNVWNSTTKGLRQLTATLKLNPISVTAESLDVLKIKWSIVAAGKPATLSIESPEPGRSYAQDDLAARIDSLERQSPSKYLLNLTVIRDMALPEPHEILFQEYEAELIDAAGRPFRAQGQAYALTDRGVQLKLTFLGESQDSAPASIRLHYPRMRARREVELVFRDVPLPRSKPE